MNAFHQFTGGFRQYNVCSYACFAYRYSPSPLLVCGGEINAQMGNISSPDYPNTPYFPEDQHDDNIRCHWKLRPPSGSYMMLTLENFFLGRKEWDHCRLVNSYNHGQCLGKICICDMRIFYMPNLSSTAANTAVSPRSSPQGTLHQCAVNPRTYKMGGGGGWGRLQPASEVFFIFFLDGKTSAPDVFSSCSFIPRAHFETSLVMVSHYGYEIWRHK